jgi:uncharacterized membrane-anchored protein
MPVILGPCWSTLSELGRALPARQLLSVHMNPTGFGFERWERSTTSSTFLFQRNLRIGTLENFLGRVPRLAAFEYLSDQSTKAPSPDGIRSCQLSRHSIR